MAMNSLTRLIGGLVICALLGWSAGQWVAYRATSAEALPSANAATERAFGVHVDLTRLTPAARQQFYQQKPGTWIRLPISWAELQPTPGAEGYRWAKYDEVIGETHTRAKILVVLQETPDWARERDQKSSVPTRDLAVWGRFVADFAQRYRGKVAAYQIWDEPNIATGWGGQFPDAAAYVALLREAAINIRAADPNAQIISAALAPTTESGPLNIHEPEYLRRLYRAGGRDFFDAVGAQPFGFWSGPEDRRNAVEVLNFSRVQLLREVMLAQGDGDKAIWATSFGWRIGKPEESPFGGDQLSVQIPRTLNAIQRARDEWPWLGPLFFARWQPEGTNDPRAGFALLQPNETRSLLLDEVTQALATHQQLATTGRHRANDGTASLPQGWRATADGLDWPQHGTTPLRIAFRGTRFDLTTRRGAFEAVLFVRVDGQPANALPRDEQGRSYVVLYDPLAQVADVTVAEGLSDGVHSVEITPQGGWGQWAIVGWVVVREGRAPWGWPVAGALLGASGFLVFAFRRRGSVLALGVIQPMTTVRTHLVSRLTNDVDSTQAPRAARLTPHALPIFIVAALLHLSPNISLSLAAVAMLAVLIVWHLDAGLMLAALAIPFYLQPKPLIGGSFAIVELTTWLCALAFAARWLSFDRRNGRELWQTLQRHWTAMDSVVLLWLIAGVGGVLSAENFGVANRELRTVFLTPALFYALIRLTGANGAQLANAYLTGAFIVSLKAISDWFTGVDLITAEGVLRARSVYFSPNNLALYLDRALPLAVCLMLFGAPEARWRWTYGVISGVILAALYLTFAKGAWLLALPAAFLFIGLLKGRKVFIGALLAVIALGAALIPWIGTARFRLDAITSVFRLQVWQASVAMIRDHPISGIGLDNFLYQYRTHYILPTAFAEANLSHPHNLWLDFWTRLGLLGVILLGALLFIFWQQAIALYRTPNDDAARALTLGVMAAMIAALAHGLIDNSFFLVDLAFVLMLHLFLVVRREFGV